CVLICFVLAVVPVFFGKTSPITGGHLVAISAIVAAAVVCYFVLVFSPARRWRVGRIDSEGGRMSKKAEKLLAFGFGVVFVVTMLILAIAFPSPTAFQYMVFRIVLALATAGVAVMIPGFIEVNISTWLRAGGALAVFVVVYFYNPASLIAPNVR
ncbi:MAG: hypothetical protein ACREAC_17450, partial [Blastocatellia bacterium]